MTRFHVLVVRLSKIDGRTRPYTECKKAHRLCVNLADFSCFQQFTFLPLYGSNVFMFVFAMV